MVARHPIAAGFTGLDPHRSGDRRAVLLLVDGARPDVFDDLVAAGDLPNVARYVLEPGGAVSATTVFPSTTCVAYLPFLTGCYPGTCNVPGIRWLDVARYGGRWWRDREHVRSYCGYQGGLLDRDMAPSIPSLFDIVPGAVGICTPIARGLDPARTWTSGARALWGALGHYPGGYTRLDRAVGRDLLRTATERPELVFAVFPGVDGETHARDPWHPRVLETYRAFDRVLGAYAAAGGLDDEPLLMLVSDHGLSRVPRHTDVAVELERMGCRTLRHPLLWRRNPTAAVMVSGNGAAHVYLRPGIERTRRFTLSEIEAGEVRGVSRLLADRLADRPGIAFVAAADGDGVVVLSRNGRARLRATATGIAYEPLSADVLELGPATVLPDRVWLRRTIDGRFPDAPAQLLQVFRSARAGDLIVAAAEGVDLRGPWEIPEHRSGHGSLVNEHMRCLLAANVPLPSPLRTVDVFPRILQHLGRSLPEVTDAGDEGLDRPLPVRRRA
jgi:hypothetical protein